jgi:hypothetical protein
VCFVLLFSLRVSAGVLSITIIVRLLLCVFRPSSPSHSSFTSLTHRPLTTLPCTDYNLIGTCQEANASKVEKKSAVQMQKQRKVAGLDDFLNQQHIRAHQTRLHGVTAGRTPLIRAGGRGGESLPSKKANRRGRGRTKRWD